MTDFILAVLVLLVVIFAVDYQANQEYYHNCTQQHSYLRCFYDHVLKPD